MTLTRNYHLIIYILHPVGISSSKSHSTALESRNTEKLTKQIAASWNIVPSLNRTNYTETTRPKLQLSPSLCMRALQIISVPNKYLSIRNWQEMELRLVSVTYLFDEALEAAKRPTMITSERNLFL
jgi:hypothetical protein